MARPKVSTGQLGQQVARRLHEQRFKKAETFRPMPKQLEFVALGATKRERALIAANRSGKSEIATFELAAHATGIYPPWWTGHRFPPHKPIRCWAIGETAASTRDVLQQKLCGPPGVLSAWGTGMIPKALLGDRSLGHGASNAIDTLQVKNVSGQVSQIKFMQYSMSRETFQGDTIDFVLMDEEPPMEIYAEVLTRLVTTRGLSVVSMTPLKGRTTLVIRFMDEPGPQRAYLTQGLRDCIIDAGVGLYSAEQVEEEIENFPEHQRLARAFGVPQRGEGRAFTALEAMFTEEPFAVPEYFYKLWGIDFGIRHPFGAALIAWDRDNDIIHLTNVLRIKDGTPVQHVPRMRAIAANPAVAWPHDGNARDKGSGIALADQYRNPLPGMEGLRLLDEHATWPDGGYSPVAAVTELNDRIATGRFKVFAGCTEFFDEYRELHWLDDKLNPVNDDVLSALFKALMMRRYARPGSFGVNGRRSAAQSLPSDPYGRAIGSSFDLFTGQPFQPWDIRP